MLKISLGDQAWDFDPAYLSNKEAKAIEQFTGQRISVFQNAKLSTSDADHMTVIVWLCRRRAGESVKLEDIDFDINALDVEDGAPDPTTEPPAADPTAAAAVPTETPVEGEPPAGVTTG